MLSADGAGPDAVPGPPVRLGVLGCAGIARRRMLPAMAACPAVEVAAVASRSRDTAESTARQYGCRAVHGYEALLADDTLDAVYVPLPAALHERWTRAALEAGRHVLAEKPLTLQRDATARLFALAQERGRVLVENVMFVHHGQHEAVRELVGKGAIGELRAFRAEFTVPRRPGTDIRYRPELGGGALWDTGVYPVRAALHFLGHALDVVGASLTRGPGFSVDTGGSALLRTPAGVTAQLAFGLDHGYRSAYELCGSQGRITLEHAFTPPADRPPVVRVEHGEGGEEIRLAAEDQVAAAVAAFARAVRSGWAPTEDSRQQAELLHGIRRAAGLGGLNGHRRTGPAGVRGPRRAR